MITAEDFIHLQCTPEDVRAGIAYALRSLRHTYNRMHSRPIRRLQRIAAGLAVESAFQRYLQSQHIPFDLLGATHFTRPDRYDLALGGRRCDIKSFLLRDREQIRAVRREPASLLNAPALIPQDQFRRSPLRPEDVYIFAFLAALTAEEQTTWKKALDRGQPLYLVWLFARGWPHASRLALKQGGTRPLRVTLSGEGKQGFTQKSITLQPGRVHTLKLPFKTLHFIHPKRPPDGPLGVHNPQTKETRVIQPTAWRNIWVYGMEIYLTGVISRREFKSNARLILAGSKVFQYRHTSTHNLAVSIRSLHPLRPFLERVLAARTGSK
ncbi:MAG: hypothetical protein D6803_07570 [Anaerolineae bacterium]|nr:MAG: hypothetical protein D6803_07570 [Anaerolineae bacterium]